MLERGTGYLHYASAEMTALELMGYPTHAGGLDNAATVAGELASILDQARLADAARRCPVSWSQRLGYVFELLGEDALAGVLESFVSEHAKSYTPLRRLDPTAGAERSRKWKLIVNSDLEPDL